MEYLFKDLKLFQLDLPACQASYKSGTKFNMLPFFFIK